MKNKNYMHKISTPKQKIAIKIALLLTLIISVHSFAQENTMYYIDGIPDVTYLNPAKQPLCNIYIGAPGISSSNSFYNSAFTFEDIIYNSPSSDAVITPLHPEGDFDKFINLFKKSNIISLDSKFNLASIGFRTNRMYFSINVAYNQNLRFSYPDDFMKLLLTGNENGATYDLTSFGIDGKSYMEYSVGVSRKIMDNLTVGIRPKLYTGFFAMQSDFTNVSLSTSYDEWNLNANGNINVAIPLIDFPLNEDGEFDISDNTLSDDISDEVENLADGSTSITSALFANKGLGVDLGVVYNPLQEMELSASIVDLGYIKWKKHTHAFGIDGQFSQGPFDYEDITENDSLFEGIMDTIKTQLQIQQSSPVFKTSMEPSLFLGGRYFVSETFNVGLLSHTKFYEDHVREDMTLSTNFRPSRAFNISLSYSLLDGKYLNFGYGFSVRIAMFHLFFVVDDISLNRYEIAIEDAPFNPSISRDSKSINYRGGLTLVFGCNKNKKLQKDKPLLYSEDAFIY